MDPDFNEFEDDEDMDFPDGASEASPQRMSRMSDLDGGGRGRLSSYGHRRLSFYTMGKLQAAGVSRKMCVALASSRRSLS